MGQVIFTSGGNEKGKKKIKKRENDFLLFENSCFPTELFHPRLKSIFFQKKKFFFVFFQNEVFNSGS